jgi:abhydrolase domain-containing protein 6
MVINILHGWIRNKYRRNGFASQKIDIGQCVLHYYERRHSSSSPTIVLLHGLGTSSSTWVNLFPRLNTECNVVALDLPGFGYSQIKDGRPFFLFHELLESLGVFFTNVVQPPFILLGHSLGGWLAAKYAITHPNMVRHLILVDSAGILSGETIRQGEAFQIQTLNDVRKLLDTIWFRYPWYFKPFYPAVRNDLRKRRVSDFVRSIRPEDFVNEDLGKLKMRVSIVWGKEDKLTTSRSLEVLEESISHAAVYRIERCGHVTQLERPNEFIGIVRRLLEDETHRAVS